MEFSVGVGRAEPGMRGCPASCAAGEDTNEHEAGRVGLLLGDFLRDSKKLDDFGNPISNYSEGEVLEIIKRHSSITSQVQYLSIGRAFHVWLKEVRPRKQAKKAANTSWKKRKSGA